MAPRTRPRVVVLGDLVIDVVLAPERAIESGTDVPGMVVMRQGGSAANTARWLGRVGADVQLVCAVGRDGAGRSLVDQVRHDDVTVRASRVAGRRTGRIGVLVLPGGERSFVADRRAALALRPEDLKPEWFDRVQLLHLPAYSLLGEPLASAARHAVSLVRAQQGEVSLDLSSIGPLLAEGRRAARELVTSVAPDILFATETEAEAYAGRNGLDRLIEQASVVVVKRGSRGARVLARESDAIIRFDIATKPIVAKDSTGAGDAFDAGFIAGWLAARAAGHPLAASLQRATVSGHRVAARQLTAVRQELPPG